jgi:hypothetical protein
MASIGQAAKHVFMSERNFKTLLDSKVFSRASRGDYNLDEVRKEWITHLQNKLKAAEGGGKSDLSSARARVAVAHAEKSEFENEQAQGKWVKVDEVASYYSAEVLLVREHLLTMPGKVADPLHMIDRIEAYAVVKDEVYESLDKLASGRAASDLVVDTIRKCGGKLSADSGLAKFLEQACDLLDQRREMGDLRKINKPVGDDDD